MKSPKFRKTKTFKINVNKKVYQIIALKDFGYIKKGNLGGWIQYKRNLSQEGNCWVARNAIVRDNAVVMDNAKVTDKAEVGGHAKVSDYAIIEGDAQVRGWAEISSHALITGDACVGGNAVVTDNAVVSGEARIKNAVKVYGEAKVYVPIDFNCDFDPWEVFTDLLKSNQAPLLIGINPNLDKMLEHHFKGV